MCGEKIVENFHLITHDKYCHKEESVRQTKEYDNVIKMGNVMDLMAILHNIEYEKNSLNCNEYQ